MIFLRGTLLPQLHAFDGENDQLILVLDNCAIHHTDEVTAVAQQAGILLLFLPAYSPDLNPVEKAFGFVKQYLQEHDELLQTLPNPIDVLKHAFDAITPSHCNSWISHAGYFKQYNNVCTHKTQSLVIMFHSNKNIYILTTAHMM